VRWLQIDWLVVVLGLGLVATGLVMVRTVGESDALYDRVGPAFSSHVKKLVVAAPFLLLGLFVRPRWLRSNAWVFFGAAIILLMLVPWFGEERNNARRWIPLPFGFDLQPSELAKPALILAMARLLYTRQLHSLRSWAFPLALALLPILLVAAQPDLGTALTIVPVTLGMGYMAGGRGKTILLFVAGGLLVGLSAWGFDWIEGYQKKRIDTWIESFEPEALIASRNGAAFHTYQARVAIGNGGWEGRGLGEGVANKAGHLPERESDSIFAVIAEEGGFVGATGLILAYGALVSLLLLSAGSIRDRFSRLVVGGVAFYFAAHFFINVGVNLGLLPMTGLTLPLVSTGGSSLLSSLLCLGLGLGLSARSSAPFERDPIDG